MQIIITGRNLDLTPAIKNYIEDKFGGLEKFYEKIIRADVVLLKDTHQQKGEIFVCECKMEVPGNDLFVSKEEVDMYKAIDKVSDHLAEEIKKHKDKIRANQKQKREERREQKSYQI